MENKEYMMKADENQDVTFSSGSLTIDVERIKKETEDRFENLDDLDNGNIARHFEFTNISPLTKSPDARDELKQAGFRDPKKTKPFQVKIIAPQSDNKVSLDRQEIKRSSGDESVPSQYKSSKKSALKPNPAYNNWRIKTNEDQQSDKRKQEINELKKSFRHEFKLSGIVQEIKTTPRELETSSKVKKKYMDQIIDEYESEYQNVTKHSVIPFFDKQNNFLEKNFDINTNQFANRICTSL